MAWEQYESGIQPVYLIRELLSDEFLAQFPRLLSLNGARCPGQQVLLPGVHNVTVFEVGTVVGCDHESSVILLRVGAKAYIYVYNRMRGSQPYTHL
jgi:hypothetical protein